MINKKIIALCICLVSASQTTFTRRHRTIKGATILVSKLLKAIDGKSFGLHGKTIRAILVIRTRILHMLHGTAQKDGSRLGSYTFDGNTYTVSQLQEAEDESAVAAEIIHAWLNVVKADFGIQIHPFLELGRGFKPQMLILIEESLRLHRREDSILHMWAGEAEGQDMIAFERNVQSFDNLSVFLHDLLNFLDDLISSCPKACKQFIDSLKTEREKIAYAQRIKQVFEKQKAKINSYR